MGWRVGHQYLDRLVAQREFRDIPKRCERIQSVEHVLVTRDFLAKGAKRRDRQNPNAVLIAQPSLNHSILDVVERHVSDDRPERPHLSYRVGAPCLEFGAAFTHLRLDPRKSPAH